jgi:hypothetical protein
MSTATLKKPERSPAPAAAQSPQEVLQEAEQSLSICRGVVADLERRQSLTQGFIVGLNGRERPLALAAAKQDAEAFEHLRALRRDRAAAEQEVKDLGLAIAEAVAEVNVAIDVLEVARRDVIFAQVQQTAREFIAESRKIDGALHVIASALERRRHLQAQIGRTRVLPPEQVEKLNCPTRLDCAVRAAKCQRLQAGPFKTDRDCHSLAYYDASTLGALLPTGKEN